MADHAGAVPGRPPGHERGVSWYRIPMSNLPVPNESDIRARVGEQSFERGLEYFRRGAISDTRRQGAAIKAYCEGSRAEPYRVHVTLGEKGIAGTDCSCPVGAGCKHVAALLLTWRAHPEQFVTVPEVPDALAQRSKEELIALIHQMLRRHPELETLLEPPPTAAGRRTPVDAQIYRRQADYGFGAQSGRRWGRDSWDMEHEAAEHLETLTATGAQFLARGDYASATAVYQGVMESLLENFESVADEGVYLGFVMDDCIKSLGRCLDGLRGDDAGREVVLAALFDAYRTDMESGGHGLVGDIPDAILQRATPEERRLVAGWVRAAMPPEKGAGGGYRVREYAGFLLRLEADTLDDEEYLRICRETGRRSDLVARLLALGRVDEARQEVAAVPDHELARMADLFVQHKQGDAGERLMLERARKGKDLRVLEWLQTRYAATGNADAQLQVVEEIYRAVPSFERYKQARELARSLGAWDDLRPDLIAILKSDHVDTRARVHVGEGVVEQGVQVAQSLGGPADGGDVGVYVAEAAEATQPRAALELYRKVAEGIIAARRRKSYAIACTYLARMRALHQRLGEDKAWEEYVAGLQDQNRRVSTLLDEMRKAGL